MARLFPILPLIFCALALPAAAQTPDASTPSPAISPSSVPATQPLPDMTLSAEIGTNGIGPTATRLAALPAPKPDEIFALAALRFLDGIESAVQLRWRVGLSENFQGLPLLRLPIPENPAPAPFDPAMITTLFTEVAAGMDGARASLAKLPADAEFGLDIALSDLWFDIDGDGVRTSGEGLADIAGPALLGWQWQNRDTAAPLPVVRFDTADAAWLSAYTHFLSGVAQTVLAYDPTTAIARVLDARAQLGLLGGTHSDDFNFETSFGDFMDVFAMISGALAQQPDPAFALAAQDHFLSMINENRRFWALIDAETDDLREWIPNDRQASGLGLDLPQGTGAAWLSVLKDAEALLRGDLLAPYWRGGDDVGINLGMVFTDPRPVDLIGWVQGWGALPYLQKGPVVSSQSWRSFEAMVQGESLMFMVLFN